MLCFCACLLRLKSEVAHVGKQKSHSHISVQTTEPPPEAVTFCENISMFSRSSLLHSSTHPSCLTNSTKPDSLSLTPAMLYTMWNSFIRSDSNQHVPGYAAARGSAWEVGKRRAKQLERCSAGRSDERELAAPAVMILATSSPRQLLLLLLLTWLWPLSDLCTCRFNKLSLQRGRRKKLVFSFIRFIKGSSKCCCQHTGRMSAMGLEGRAKTVQERKRRRRRRSNPPPCQQHPSLLHRSWDHTSRKMGQTGTQTLRRK